MTYYQLSLVAGILIAIAPVRVYGEPQFIKEYDPFPVSVNSETLELPFWGGISSARPSLVDMNHDGLLDLLLGERTGKVSLLLNDGTPQLAHWRPSSERLGGITGGFWYCAEDLDNDGDQDLVVDGRQGYGVYYRNDSIDSTFTFTLVDSSLGDMQTGVNLAPDFADIDGDGDLDFFVGNVGGGLDFYRNIGTAISPSFVFITDFYDSVFAFPGAPRISYAQHGASTLTFHDVDSDGDLDLFYGDILNHNNYYFVNMGTPQVSHLKKKSDEYLPFNTLNGQNHVGLGDIDADGDPDLLLSGTDGDLIKNFIFLRNAGVPSRDSFVVETERYLNCIDAGSNTVPALGDIDNDGDLDLLIGNEFGSVSLYQNVGSRTEPALEFVTDSFQSIDVGLSSAPELTDWDSDGDLDMLIGIYGNNVGGVVISGKIELWRNDGTPENMSLVKADPQLGGIKVDILATPRVADFDDDGLKDLLVGEWDYNGAANLLLYRNVGTATNPQLALVTNKLLKRSFRDFTMPQVCDWDGDGRKDIVLGGAGYGVTLFRNSTPFGVFPDSNSLISQADTIPGADDGQRAAVAFADIDGDGDVDGFVGEEDGGVNFYRNVGAPIAIHGDLDGNGMRDIADAILLVRYLLTNSPTPPNSAGADANCSGDVNVSDIIFLLRFLYQSGPAPCG